MQKFFCLGLILFLSTGCLPQIHSPVAKNHLDVPISEETESSLFTQSELEELFSDQPVSLQADAVSSYSSNENQAVAQGLDLPISDESSDDFNLDLFPTASRQAKKSFDIPIVINEKVEYFIQYFQTRIKNHFSSWLARSEKYIPFMRDLLKENGLPEDLVYLALIESGFNPYAYSRSKAMGPWQFIYLTGKRYGLKVDWWVDERRDPEKSTIAAAKYLKDLYDMFECWYLAAAGYNAGENKIANAMKKYRTEDFWELTKYRYLKPETKHYVPQMIAAALIAKDPEKYGFVNIEYQEPLRYDKVKVPPAVDLRVIAKASEISLDELKELNPELRRWCTPPGPPDYEIKVPAGKKDLLLNNLEPLLSEAKTSFKTHIVKKGETPQAIAKRYRVDLEPILEINQLEKKTRLAAGTNLLIPLPKEMEKRPDPPGIKPSNGKDANGKSEEIIYTIKKGDSLWSIANETGVNIGSLTSLNKLRPGAKLMPGDQLKIRVTSMNDAPVEVSQDENGKKEILYVVKSGDSLWTIASKYNVSVSEIKSWNNMNGNDRIFPSDKLKLRVEEPKS